MARKIAASVIVIPDAKINRIIRRCRVGSLTLHRNLMGKAMRIASVMKSVVNSKIVKLVPKGRSAFPKYKVLFIQLKSWQ